MNFAAGVQNGRGEEPQIADGPGDIHGTCQVDWLAAIDTLGMGKSFQAVLDAISQAEQHLRSPGRCLA